MPVKSPHWAPKSMEAKLPGKKKWCKKKGSVITGNFWKTTMEITDELKRCAEGCTWQTSRRDISIPMPATELYSVFFSVSAYSVPSHAEPSGTPLHMCRTKAGQSPLASAIKAQCSITAHGIRQMRKKCGNQIAQRRNLRWCEHRDDTLIQ